MEYKSIIVGMKRTCLGSQSGLIARIHYPGGGTTFFAEPPQGGIHLFCLFPHPPPGRQMLLPRPPLNPPPVREIYLSKPPLTRRANGLAKTNIFRCIVCVHWKLLSNSIVSLQSNGLVSCHTSGGRGWGFRGKWVENIKVAGALRVHDEK